MRYRRFQLDQPNGTKDKIKGTNLIARGVQIMKSVHECNDKVTKLQNPEGKHIEHDKWYAEVSYTRRLHSVRRYCRLLANITLYSAAVSEVIPDKAFRSGIRVVWQNATADIQPSISSLFRIFTSL